MYKKNDITFAEAGNYLKRRAASEISFQAEGESSEFEEVKIAYPYEITVMGDILLFDGIAILAEEMSKKAIKMHIVKMRYTNDDQIAVMLNKDDSEEDRLSFERMQAWRKFADDVAEAAINSKTNIL